MASYLALSCEGHQEMLYITFAHLKKHHNTEMVFDPSKPRINNNDIERKDWRCSEFNSAIKKEREARPRTPIPIDTGFAIVGKVNEDYAGYAFKRRSRTRFLVHLNSAPDCWHSKKQNKVETSSF